MVIRKAFKYRLYPTRAQAEELDRILWRCRELYNAAVYQRREAYHVCGIGVTYCMQQNELPAGISQVRSGCGRSVPKTLSDRWHTCPYEDCGLSLQRDHNTARELLNRAGLARAVRPAPAAESHGPLP